MKYDLIIIGGGPGGYVSAIKAAQKGLKVALVEKNLIGGTCLNEGCIPTKTLLAHVDIYQTILNGKKWGIHTGKVSFNFSQIKNNMNTAIRKLSKQLQQVLIDHKVKLYAGRAKFISRKTIEVSGKKPIKLIGKQFILSTGSSPIELPKFPYDNKLIFHSTSILYKKQLPKHLVIIGGGYIGCEFASLYRGFGSKVTIIEKKNHLLPPMGLFITKQLEKAFTKQGINVLTNSEVVSMEKKAKSLKLTLSDKTTITSDCLLVSVGRGYNSSNLGLEKLGICLAERGKILVNEYLQTNDPDVYAIGDVSGKILLGHYAFYQGQIAAMNVCGITRAIQDIPIPSVVFSDPEVATVGLSVDEAKSVYGNVLVGKLPLNALAKSISTIESDGYAIVVADKKTRKLVGAQIIGKHASILIGEMTLAIQHKLSLDDLMQAIHAHPSLPEAWTEAALLADEMPIHTPKRSKKK